MYLLVRDYEESLIGIFNFVPTVVETSKISGNSSNSNIKVELTVYFRDILNIRLVYSHVYKTNNNELIDDIVVTNCVWCIV